MLVHCRQKIQSGGLMRKKILSIIGLMTLCLPTVAMAFSWRSLGETVWNVTKGVANSIAQVANAVLKSVTGIDLINKPSSFAERLSWFTDDCWFCGVFGQLFDIMNTIVTEICSSMKPVFLTLLGLGLLFWLLYRVGRIMIDLTGEPDTKLVPDILKQAMRVMVASLMIVMYTDVFTYILSPALELGIGIGNEILSTSQDGYQDTMVRTGGYKGSAEGFTSSLCPDYDQAVSDEQECSSDESCTIANDKAFSEVTKQAFLCYIQVGEKSFSVGMAIGATAISAWSGKNIVSKVMHLELLIIGLEIFLIFFLLFLAFPTKLFDPLMNLAFVTALYPLWIVLWAFPATNKQYTKQALSLFIGVIVHLLVISVISMMVIEIMDGALGPEEVRNQLFNDLLSPRDPYDIFIETYGFGCVGKPILLTAALGILAYLLFQKTSAVASQFGGILDFGVGQQAGSLLDQGVGFTAQAGKNVTAAGAHVAHGGWRKMAQRDDGLGKAARAVGRWAPAAAAAAALAPIAPVGWAVGAALGARAISGSRMPIPKNRVHSNSLFDRFVRTKKKKDASGNSWWLNKKNGKSSRQNKQTKEWDTYDSNTRTYQEFDKASRLQNSYKQDSGDIKMNGQDYKFKQDANGDITIESGGVKYAIDSNGNVTNLTSGNAVDTKKRDEIREVLAFRQNAENNIREHLRMMASLP